MCYLLACLPETREREAEAVLLRRSEQLDSTHLAARAVLLVLARVEAALVLGDIAVRALLEEGAVAAAATLAATFGPGRRGRGAEQLFEKCEEGMIKVLAHIEEQSA